MKIKKIFKASLFFASIMPFIAANAEIIIHGTRIIYPSDSREITIQVTNDGKEPSLVQTWVDDGNANSAPSDAKAPFMITPPISRVDPKKGQTFRLTALPKTASLSKTQETLFWLNVVDIPPKPITKDDDSENQENYLQLAIRSRIKLFYRPTGLKQDAASAPEKLKWSKSGTTFTVKNPTPYYITISSINSEINGKSSDITPEGVMINPFSEQKIDIKNTNVGKLTFTTLNDYGSRVVNDLKLD